jgi:hypothetical protein
MVRSASRSWKTKTRASNATGAVRAAVRLADSAASRRASAARARLRECAVEAKSWRLEPPELACAYEWSGETTPGWSYASRARASDRGTPPFFQNSRTPRHSGAAPTSPRALAKMRMIHKSQTFAIPDGGAWPQLRLCDPADARSSSSRTRPRAPRSHARCRLAAHPIRRRARRVHTPSVATAPAWLAQSRSTSRRAW